MKSLPSESISNAYFNTEQLGRSSRLAWEFRLWNDFGTVLIQTQNVSCNEPKA